MKSNGQARGVMGKEKQTISNRFSLLFRDLNNWNKVDPHTREQLRYQKQADGEFW